MADPPKKQRTQDPAQLVALRRGPYLSKTALSSVLGLVREQGLPSASSRSSQLRARKRICSEATPYGPCIIDAELPLTNGPCTVAFQSPFAIIWKTVKESVHFRTMLRDALRAHPSTPQQPWNLIIYFDEISPNNPLARGHDLRNTQCVYWSFLELGHLWQEDVWMVVAAVRSHMIYDDLPGGMTHFLTIVMKLFFDDAGHHFARTGVMLDFGDGEDTLFLRLFANHAATIADFKAHAQLLCSKGQSGTKPCPMCRNVIDHKKSVVPLAGGGLLPFTSTDTTTWKLHTDASIRALVEKLRNASTHMGNPAFKELQTIHGWTHNPWNILADASLKYKAASTMIFDWMHVWCIDGVFARSFNSLMDEIHKKKLNKKREDLPTFADVHNYLQLWQWPKQFASARRICETGSFSATASETLSAAPVLAKYFLDVVRPMGGCNAAIDSFALACEVIPLLNEMVRGYGTPQKLFDATKRCLESHLNAHGETNWVLKSHMALHLPLMWEAMPKGASGQRWTLPSCFSLERKHKSIKKHMRDNLRGQSYERAVLEEVTLDHLESWKTPAGVCGMVRPHKPSKWIAIVLEEAFGAVENVTVADVLVADNGSRFSKNDLVLLRDGSVGAVQYHCSFGDRLLTCIELRPLLRIDLSKCIAKYSVTPQTSYISSDLLQAAAVFKVHNSVVTAIWPLWCVSARLLT